jgi:glutamate-1-semialdehyde aminotransferase
MESKTLECKKCGIYVIPDLVKKSNNYVAYCSKCKSYIKNVPHTWVGCESESTTFFIGKYKGMRICDCTDKQYLQWCMLNMKVSSRMDEEIKARIKEL